MSLTKICTRCKVEKPMESFYNYKASKDGRSYRCKDCDKIQGKAYRERHKERDRVNRRNESRRRKYGLSEDGYNKIIEYQNDTCPICLRHLTHGWGQFHKATKAVVDHCHDTGITRGILCTQCNKGIGLLKDDPDFLLRAIEYLKSGTDHSDLR